MRSRGRWAAILVIALAVAWLAWPRSRKHAQPRTSARPARALPALPPTASAESFDPQAIPDEPAPVPTRPPARLVSPDEPPARGHGDENVGTGIIGRHELTAVGGGSALHPEDYSPEALPG